MALQHKDEWRELTALQRDIIDAKINNPDWTHERIAEEVDSAPTHVTRVLNAYSDIVDERRDRLLDRGGDTDPLEDLEKNAEEPGADRDNGRVETNVGLRGFEGSPIDSTYQSISERPDKDRYVDVTIPEDTVVDLVIGDELNEHARRSMLQSLLEEYSEE